MKVLVVFGIITLAFVSQVHCFGGPADHFSNDWIMKASLAKTDITQFAATFGFTVLDQVKTQQQ